jgi:hypothetical protein
MEWSRTVQLNLDGKENEFHTEDIPEPPEVGPAYRSRNLKTQSLVG